MLAVRGHSGIDDQLHWVLDVAFREEDCRVRAGNATANFSAVRQLALGLLKKRTEAKCGIKIPPPKSRLGQQVSASNDRANLHRLDAYALSSHHFCPALSSGGIPCLVRRGRCASAEITSWSSTLTETN